MWYGIAPWLVLLQQTLSKLHVTLHYPTLRTAMFPHTASLGVLQIQCGMNPIPEVPMT